MPVLHLTIILLLSYLAGSFPTSIVVGRVFFNKDIRQHGSRNAGGTNALRVFGPAAGITVMTVDLAKGVCAVLFISRLPVFGNMSEPLLSADLTALLAGIAAVVGHIWTVFAAFRGGKGVATAAGMLAALYPPAFFITLVFFILAIMLTGIVSVGSLTAAVVFPLTHFILTGVNVTDVSPVLLWVPVPVALLIVFTHRGNIGRLCRGEEPRMFGNGSKG